jgi:hypothetical protein
MILAGVAVARSTSNAMDEASSTLIEELQTKISALRARLEGLLVRL